jgi:hypothetical protein
MLLPLLFLAATGDQTVRLTKLIDHCDPIAVSHGGCGNLDKPVWRRFESATGEITKVDMTSIQPTTGGGALVTVYTFSPGSNFDINRLRQLNFTCRGQFVDIANMSYLQDAPPRSVAGRIASVICPIGNSKRQTILAENARVWCQSGRHANCCCAGSAYTISHRTRASTAALRRSCSLSRRRSTASP